MIDDPRAEDTVHMICNECGYIINHEVSQDYVECPHCGWSDLSANIDWEYEDEIYMDYIMDHFNGLVF
jgi:ribosomal protein L37E